MTRRRPLAIVLVAIALLALAFFGGSEFGASRRAPRGEVREPSAEAAGTAGAANDTTAPAEAPVAAGTDAAPPTPAATWPALPPASARVADIFDDLADRARRGDASAACRLARDLQRCTAALAQRELASNLQDEAARRDRTPGGMVDAIANLERRQEGFGEDCSGLQPAQLDRAFEFQRQAAEARPELRTWFALNPALDRRDFVTDLERWAEYRRVALPWLEAAAREGDLVALIALARVHGDLRRNSPPWPPFRIDDPVRALAYNQRLTDVGADYRGVRIGAETARARLDAAGLARAQELTDALSNTARHDTAVIGAAMNRSFDPVPAAAECEDGS